MSYGITSIGKKSNVIAEVDGNQYVPGYVKDFVKAAVSAIPDPKQNPPAWPQCDSVSVIANGHHEGGHTVTITTFNEARVSDATSQKYD